MRKIIYLRKSPDWSQIKTIDDFAASNCDSRPLLKSWVGDLSQAIDLWNKSFKIDYFSFRERIKEIAQGNLRELSGVEFISKPDMCLIEKQYPFLLYMIDDDDLISPNVFDEIQPSIDDECHYAVWPFGFLRHFMKVTNIYLPIHNIKFVYSNNCIVTHRGYELLRQNSDPYSFLEDHREVDEIFDKTDSIVKVINYPHSVYNQTPASATNLWGMLKHKKSIYSLLEGYGKTPIIPHELQWSVPHVERIFRLISMLVRKTHI